MGHFSETFITSVTCLLERTDSDQVVYGSMMTDTQNIASRCIRCKCFNRNFSYISYFTGMIYNLNRHNPGKTKLDNDKIFF